jgi:hypothetical protein
VATAPGFMPVEIRNSVMTPFSNVASSERLGASGSALLDNASSPKSA